MIACAASIALGGVLVWRLLAPESIGAVQTPELLAMLGLLVLPLLTFWAFVAQRRAGGRRAAAVLEPRVRHEARPDPRAESRRGSSSARAAIPSDRHRRQGGREHETVASRASHR